MIKYWKWYHYCWICMMEDDIFFSFSGFKSILNEILALSLCPYIKIAIFHSSYFPSISGNVIKHLKMGKRARYSTLFHGNLIHRSGPNRNSPLNHIFYCVPGNMFIAYAMVWWIIWSPERLSWAVVIDFRVAGTAHDNLLSWPTSPHAPTT